MRLFPFTAVVGMPELRLALLLCTISPAIGGVLVRGEKGTAKSTMVRALAGLLPAVTVVERCRFSCDPTAPDPHCPDGPHDPKPALHERPARLVELPVGAAEDRVLGSLNLERALAEGITDYQPGLLAAAHRGLLYVDEVNLLHDHLVDVLLDAAAMGRATVEREGVSVSHAARFVLIGTMNPEEGELRPQLLDRFGLTVEVASSRDPDERAEVVRRRLAYEADPDTFAERYAADEIQLANRIASARRLLPDVVLTDAALRQIAEVCASFEVDGMRADIVTARAAVASAAWDGRTEVSTEDIRVAARLALPHRRRRNPFDAPGIDHDRLEQALTDAQPPEPPQGPDDDGPGHGAPPPEADGGAPPHNGDSPTSSNERTVGAGETYRPRLFTVPGTGTGVAGHRSRARTDVGRTTRAAPTGAHPHLVATVRAAAPHQHARGRTVTPRPHPPAGGRGDGPPPTNRLLVRPDDLRFAEREGKEANLVLFCVDASGSMGARQRMREVKAAVLSLLLDAYRRRDKAGLVIFRGAGAELALPPTSSVDTAATRLASLPTGGRTPLAEGLVKAADVLRIEAIRDPRRRPLLVVVTDGRATAGADAVPRARAAATLLARTGVAAVVLDCESGRMRLGLAADLAAHLGAEHVPLADVAAAAIAGHVLARTGRAS